MNTPLPLTFRQIRDALNELSDEQLDMSATVYDHDVEEAYPVYDTFIFSELPQKYQDNIDLDDDQPLFLIGGWSDDLNSPDEIKE